MFSRSFPRSPFCGRRRRGQAIAVGQGHHDDSLWCVSLLLGAAPGSSPSCDVGLGQSSPVGPTMVGHVAEAFLDTLYKA